MNMIIDFVREMALRTPVSMADTVHLSICSFCVFVGGGGGCSLLFWGGGDEGEGRGSVF